MVSSLEKLATTAPAGDLINLINRLGSLTAAELHAFSTTDLFGRVAVLISDEVREWNEERELPLARAWTDIASTTVRARVSLRVWADFSGNTIQVPEDNGGFRGIELSRFLCYGDQGEKFWTGEDEPERLILGSDWKTVAAGVQIKAHLSDPLKILVRFAKH